jgi:glycine betaine/proline transport system substrate-binding protein
MRILLALLLGALVAGTDAAAAEPAQCRTVRFADIGWTDITATTAIASRMLEGIGYAPKIEVLSVPVTYVSLKNRDIDVFLGNWMPTMEADRRPYVENHTIEVVRPNLLGARYTLAVSQATWDMGLHGFADIAKFKDRLDGKIYGIEPGNDGNRVVLGMIKDDKYGLGDFELVESSEQGMLAELERAIRRNQPIVFLGWEPHPMNTKYRMQYLDDPQNTFGPDNGSAEVDTNVRAGYLAECPNVAQFVKNLSFTLAIEDAVMGAILFDKVEAPKAAEQWLKANPKVWTPWLDGVTTADGKPATAALLDSLGITTTGEAAAGKANGGFSLDAWIAQHRLPLGAWLKAVVDFLTANGQGFFDFVSLVLGATIAGFTTALLWVPAPIMILVFAGGAYALHRSWKLSLFIVLGLLLVLDLGYWRATIETLSLVICATVTCVAVGVPIGIAAAHRPWLYQILHPVLDLMQTIPTFVYLIPTLVLFHLGVVPGLISTVIFSIPAPIRLTHLGITSVPLQLREAGEAFGATKSQLLFKVELPAALPTIMAGVTQCIMLSLSMVVIAALVGAGGLGEPVVRALNSVNVAVGFEAGLAIVVLAIILDRVCKRPQSQNGGH